MACVGGSELLRFFSILMAFSVLMAGLGIHLVGCFVGACMCVRMLSSRLALATDLPVLSTADTLNGCDRPDRLS